VSEGEEHHVKNDETPKLQLKFEYEVYLLIYTIKIKKPKTLHWAFGFFFKLKKPLKA